MNPRPATLVETARQSDSIGDFGHHLRDWLHQLRRVSSRGQVAAAIADDPPKLKDKFPDGEIADAWLAAYAEHAARRAGVKTPKWAFAPWRVSSEPLFDRGSDTPALRILALERSPLAFKRRNIYTPTVDLPLKLRAGRPEKSIEEKRMANAKRQQRFRLARNTELKSLRKILASSGAPART
jgi:hypothetical protein